MSLRNVSNKVAGWWVMEWKEWVPRNQVCRPVVPWKASCRIQVVSARRNLSTCAKKDERVV